LFYKKDFTATAQCNPHDEVESWYSWAKDWENYAIDQFPISEKDEIIIGDSIHLKMKTENVLLPNHPKQKYLNKIVAKLTKHTQTQSIQTINPKQRSK
jgi:hypothetical protein